MSHTCNTTPDHTEAELDKETVRNHFTTAGHQMLRTGADLFTAFSYMETLDFEDALDDLVQCVDRLDTVVEHLNEAIEITEEALPLTDEAHEHFSSFDYDSLRSRAEIEELFIDDNEVWEVLIEEARSGNVTAGPRMYLSMVTELRGEVQAFIKDIERGHDDDHLLRASWSVLSSFSRIMNLGGMLSYFNRETRTPAGTGDSPSKGDLQAGETLVGD